MNTSEFLASYWLPDIPAVIVIVLMILFYLFSGRWTFNVKSLLYFSGVFLFLISTLSPLAYLAKDYLFSAMMIRHILLLLIIPPMLLAGTNANYLEGLMRTKFFNRMGRFLFNPVFTWLVGAGAMWAVHSPVYMTWLMGSSAFMDIEMIVLTLAGLIFIWPVFAPVSDYRLDALASSIYLFLACTGCTLLGILITFAPAEMFSNVISPANTPVLQMIRSVWGISWHTDQMVGGLIMWIPACVIYLTYIVIVLLRWFTTSAKTAGKL